MKYRKPYDNATASFVYLCFVKFLWYLLKFLLSNVPIIIFIENFKCPLSFSCGLSLVRHASTIRFIYKWETSDVSHIIRIKTHVKTLDKVSIFMKFEKYLTQLIFEKFWTLGVFHKLFLCYLGIAIRTTTQLSEFLGINGYAMFAWNGIKWKKQHFFVMVTLQNNLIFILYRKKS